MSSLFVRLSAMILVLAFAGVTACSAGDRPNSTLPTPAVDAPLLSANGEQTAVIAGGCFWGIQAVFQHVKGVISATSGYAGGSAKTAEYELVSTGDTGHAESVKIIYDPSKITYGQLLRVFFSVAHDPTQLNRQGPDEGTQYRSSIFYSSDEQKRIAEAYIAQLDKAKVRGAGAVRAQHVVSLLTNLVSLVRFALGKDTLLEPFSATVDRRFDEWLAQQQKNGRAFTPEQREWLAMIKDHVATSVAVGWDDFDNVPFSDKGGRVKAFNLFGQELERVMDELNTVLVA